MKKLKINSVRNPFALPAKSRKGGKMRSKKNKRKKNKEFKLLQEELNHE